MLRRHYKQYQKNNRRRELKIEQALESRSSLLFPMVLIGAAAFKALKELTSHENLRKVTLWLNTTEEIEAFAGDIIFISHQWTAFASPDPTGTQFKAMTMAIDTICSEKKWKEADTYVWLDYLSIPQEHRNCQTMAINSLTTYAANVSAFVIVAPPVTHADLEDMCDKETYQRRAWCRAEQLSHYMACGKDHMYLAEGTELTSLTDEWLEQALHVFEGELTCCRRKHVGMEQCDKQYLVIPMLGLWAKVWCKKHRTNSQTDAEIHSRMSDRLTEIFPTTFEYVTEHDTKEVELFGTLVSDMENRLQAEIDDLAK